MSNLKSKRKDIIDLDFFSPYHVVKKERRKQTKKRIVLELKRQTFHILLGLFFIFLFLVLGNFVFTVFLAFVLLVYFLSLSYLDKLYKVYPLSFFLKNFEREDVQVVGKGAFAYVAGVFIVSLVIFAFDLPMFFFLFALTPLIFGDMFSTIFGIYFGKIYLRKGITLVGTTAGFIATFLFALFFVFLFFKQSSFFLIARTLVFSLCYLVELFPLEDNITLPIAGLLFSIALFLPVY